MSSPASPTGCKSPILFLIFNRPELTARVFETIRNANPPRLYVAADGPRAGREGEAERVEAARKIATAVDWDCEVKTLFRDQNIGCGKAVSEGITWFFEQEEEGIILEDDILVCSSWFLFADEMLERCRNDAHISSICARGFELNESIASYHFSRYSIIWGWATWRRAWRNYDFNVSAWPSLAQTGFLHKLAGSCISFRHYWRTRFSSVYDASCDTWDYQWILACWRQQGLSILPQCNMVQNIGFGEDATHTKGHELEGMFPVKDIIFPLNHPKTISHNTQLDRTIDSTFFGINKLYLLKYYAGKIPILRKIKILIKATLFPSKPQPKDHPQS